MASATPLGTPSPRRPVVLAIVYGLLIVPTGLVALGAMVATVMGVAAGADGGIGLQGAVLILAGLTVMATPFILLVAVVLLLAGRVQERARLVRAATWLPVPFVGVTALVAVLVAVGT